MISNNQYLDRLRTIREKYNVPPHSKPSIIHPNDQYPTHHRNNLKNYPKSEIYPRQQNKYSDQKNIIDCGIKIGINNQGYPVNGNYEINRERQSAPGRGYSVNRNKGINDGPMKGFGKESIKLTTRKQYPNDYLRENRNIGMDHSKQKIQQLNTYYKPTRSTLKQQHSSRKLSASPVARMNNYQDKIMYRYSENIQPYDPYPLDRDRKLSQASPNRLPRNLLSNRQQKNHFDPQYPPPKHPYLYSIQNLQHDRYRHHHKTQTLDMPNNKIEDFQLSKLEQIQEKIQLLLGKK